MSRFKFACTCGKRMAAYDWMIGRIVTCPACGSTLTVPTPFQAQEKLAEMIGKGFTPTRRKIGVPLDPKARRKRIAILAGTMILVVLAAAVAALWIFLKR
jgi:hypothetical protein